MIEGIDQNDNNQLVLNTKRKWTASRWEKGELEINPLSKKIKQWTFQRISKFVYIPI